MRRQRSRRNAPTAFASVQRQPPSSLILSDAHRPRRAFFYSFLVPGYSQSVLKRNKAATLFLLVEAISIGNDSRVGGGRHEARRMQGDSTIISYVDESGQAARIVVPRALQRRLRQDTWKRTSRTGSRCLSPTTCLPARTRHVAANLWDVKAVSRFGRYRMALCSGRRSRGEAALCHGRRVRLRDRRAHGRQRVISATSARKRHLLRRHGSRPIRPEESGNRSTVQSRNRRISSR